MSASPSCRCCGSADVVLRGRKPGAFIKREFEFHACRDCGFMFVEPFSGFAIYDDAYYRGHGPDPYVDYETEYRDYRRTDRALEFADLTRLAENHFSPSLRLPVPSSPVAPSSVFRWLDFGCGAGGLLKFLRERGTLGGRILGAVES